MAYLSCLSFSLEGATEGPASAGFKVLATHRSARPMGFLGFRSGFTRIGDDNRNWVLGSHRFVRSCTTRRSLCLRAADKDSVEGSLEHEKVSENAMKETIEKSKKVLAMQRELLQQIVDRRKLVASIKNTLSNPVDADTSPESVLISNLDLGYSSDNSFKEEGDRASLSGGSDELPGSKILEKSTELFKASSGLTTSDMKALHKKYDGGLIYSGNSDSASKSSVPKAFSEKIEDMAKASRRLSIDFKEKVAYSEPELAKSSSYGYTASDVRSEVKAEEMSTSAEAFASLSSPSQEHVKPPPLAGENVMNVVLVAAECAPWKKTGGLGDVAGALPKALARRGHRVMVVVPRYGDYTEPQDIGVRKRYKVAGQDMEVNYFHSYIDGVDFVFIDSPMLRHIEKDIYGGNRMDILKRMALFCKVAVEVPWHVPCGGSCYGDGNLVFIANDWHTALLPVYLKAYYRDNGLMKYTRSVLVIHNIAHQGRGPLDDFSVLDLPEHYLDYFRLYDPVGGEHSNTFAAGIKAADRIVAVSHGYAWEVKTQEGGWGLHNIISENDWKLRGIVNGIDDEEWNPQLDEHLNSDGYTNYSLDTLQSGKAQCKAALQKELGLPVRPDVPLIGFIGRLDGQKGVDIIGEAVPWMMSQDVQLVMLGTGRRDLEEMLKKFEEQYRGSVCAWVGFSVKTAHRITAGVDVLLMPSRFEPCGLNQLYAMCYGTIPVVHAVGGLRDTVHPFDPFNETGYGWTFDRAESGKLIEALGHCLMTFREYKESWEGLQRRGMMQDMSWDHAAEIYEEVLVAAKYQW